MKLGDHQRISMAQVKTSYSVLKTKINQLYIAGQGKMTNCSGVQALLLD